MNFDRFTEKPIRMPQPKPDNTWKEEAEERFAETLLGRDLSHDLGILRPLFRHNTTLPCMGMECFKLKLSPQALVNLGYLRRVTLGRWDEGFQACAKMWEEV